MRVHTEFVQVSTTVGTQAAASRIAKRLLNNRVASCVQVVGPVKSSYWWKGKIEHASEWFCLIKGRASDYQSIENIIKIDHPYEVPEIIALPVVSGNTDYLRWIERETIRPRGNLRKRTVC